jgi:hypothetical protein
MDARSVLRWCAGDDGYLLRERLERACRARNHKPGWVYYHKGKHWQQAWEGC